MIKKLQKSVLSLSIKACSQVFKLKKTNQIAVSNQLIKQLFNTGLNSQNSLACKLLDCLVIVID